MAFPDFCSFLFIPWFIFLCSPGLPVASCRYWSETPKEPNNHESGGPQGEDCVVLQTQSKTWFDVPCDFHYKRICEMGARPCPEGWTYLDGKCYYFSEDKLDWKNSSDSCVSMGSHLTILQTQQQHVRVWMSTAVHKFRITYHISIFVILSSL